MNVYKIIDWLGRTIAFYEERVDELTSENWTELRHTTEGRIAGLKELKRWLEIQLELEHLAPIVQESPQSRSKKEKSTVTRLDVWRMDH